MPITRLFTIFTTRSRQYPWWCNERFALVRIIILRSTAPSCLLVWVTILMKKWDILLLWLCLLRLQLDLSAERVLVSILLRLHMFQLVLAVWALGSAIWTNCFSNCSQLHDWLILRPIVTIWRWAALETVFPLLVALWNSLRWTAWINHLLGFFKFIVDDIVAYGSILFIG